jgi:Golgi apparatus protein 1
LNYRLSEACQADIDTLCSEECSPILGQTCGGRVLRCLTEKQDSIKSKACADEVCLGFLNPNPDLTVFAA